MNTSKKLENLLEVKELKICSEYRPMTRQCVDNYALDLFILRLTDFTNLFSSNSFKKVN